MVTRANEEEILEPGLRRLREQLFALVGSGLFGVLVAWVVAQQKIARPMKRLVERMNRAGHGESTSGFEHVEEPPSSREFNSLNESLVAMLEKLQLQQAAVASSIDGIVICDARQKDLPMVYVNPAFEQSTGYPAAEALGKNCRFLQGNDHDQPGLRELRLALAEHKEATVTIRNYRRDGTMFWNSLRVSPVRNTRGVVTHFVGVQTDVTDRIQKEDELARRAYHDWLTGLPNRKLLEDRITQSIERSKRENFEFSVAFIDLDNFKVFNDSMGHRAGDSVLVEIAKRLAHSVRSEDTVCRIGGDEFVVVYAGLSDSVLLHEALERLQRCLMEPLVVDDRECLVAASIGLAIFPRDGESAQTLLQHADVAMYKAKSDGRGVVRAYTPSLDSGSVEKLELANSLRRGLINKEFELHFQPKVMAASGQLVGFEALLRWRHPTMGLVSPQQFIPLAEQTGLIVGIGRWVLEETCRQVQQWRTDGVMDVPVAVNVSAIQFRQDDLGKTIAEVLAHSGLPPDRLHIEITESVMIDGHDDLYRVLTEIRAQGIKVALDDFGTGYSSLSYLKRFPVDYVKIDRSFVRDIATDPADAAICSAIIAMAHILGIQVIAEGVETLEQAVFLRSKQCDDLQGYFIDKPRKADELNPIGFIRF